MNLDQVLVLPSSWVMILAALSPALVSLLAKYQGDDTHTHEFLAALIAVALAVIGMLTDNIPNDTLASIISQVIAVGTTQLFAYKWVASKLSLNAKLMPNKGLSLSLPLGKQP